MGLNFTYFQRKNVVNYGLEILGYSTNFSFHNVVNREISQKENTTEFAAYLKYKWISGNVGKDSTQNRTLTSATVMAVAGIPLQACRELPITRP